MILRRYLTLLIGQSLLLMIHFIGIAIIPISGFAEEQSTQVLGKDPSPEMERPTTWGEPTEVQLGIYVIDIDEVDSAKQDYSASIYYEARWNSPFLRHKGPGPVHRSLTEIWTPRLVIVSQQMAWMAFPEFVQIDPDGTAIYRQKVWGRFSQPLDLREFPFDKQILSIHFVAVGLQQEHINLVPLIRNGQLTQGIAGVFSLPDFNVLSWSADPTPYYAFKEGTGTAGFEMNIEIGRDPFYYILKVIIPLCLIVIMSWLPRWIDPKNVGVNIGIATTAFLTLIAYLFSIAILLPKVSYVTRMDRFIFLSTILVFIGLIQTAFDTLMISRNRERIAHLVNRLSRYLYPLLLLGVLLVSFWL